MTPVIDFHAHLLTGEGYERTWMYNVASGFGANGRPPAGSRFDLVNRKMMNAAEHVEDMDRLGIDVEVISLSTVIAGGQWADPQTDLEINRDANDAIAEAVRAHPDRIVGSFSLPLQDTALSLAELERCVDELGLRIANVPANAQGVYLGNPRFDPFWEAVDDRGLVVFVHPDGVRDPWFQEYSLWNSVGQPIEEAKVISSIVYEGVLERRPGLRIVMAHGGGYLPHYYGRHDRNVHNMPESARNISKPPSEYLKLFYYDTCVYTPHVLEELVDLAGPEHVLMGSDYPVGEADPLGFVDRARNVGPAEAAAIKGGSAARLLEAAGALPAAPAGR